MPSSIRSASGDAAMSSGPARSRRSCARGHVADVGRRGRRWSGYVRRWGSTTLGTDLTAERRLPVATASRAHEPPAREQRPITLGVVGVVVLLAALWGGTAVAIKVGLRDLPALGLAGFRFAVGLLVVLGWARARNVPMRLRPGEAA